MESTSKVEVREADRTVVRTYVGIASWEVKAPFLVLHYATGGSILIQVDPAHVVEVIPDGPDDDGPPDRAGPAVSGDRLERPRGGPPPDGDTRQLAIAGVHRRLPAEDVDEVLAALGLIELERPVVPDTVYCGCGKRIKVRGVDRCSYCRGGRTKSATGGDA